MNRKLYKTRCARRGVIAVLAAFVLVFLIAMVALAVDYGHILKMRTDMQRAADAAALAAVQDLVPAADGSQDLDSARATVSSYAPSNLIDASFQVLDSDIEMGRFDTATIYSNVSLLNSGTYDTVRVTLRCDGTTNPLVSTIFARAFGYQGATVTTTATAVLQKPVLLGPGVGILPFSIPLTTWGNRSPGDIWVIYGDGKMEDDSGASIPGNWGTVDIGASNNSTADLRDQILDGLRQQDIDALYNDGRISSDQHIDASEFAWLNADPGLSSGIKSAVQAVHGESRLVPIFDSIGGTPNGNNLEYQVVRWGVITVVDSNWNGANNTYVKVQKSYTYNGLLNPKPDLTIEPVIEGAFTSPVLVE